MRMKLATLIAAALTAAILACGGEAEPIPGSDPGGNHGSVDPASRAASALTTPTMFVAEATNTACNGTVTRDTHTMPTGVDRSNTLFFLNHVEGNINFAGNPEPENVTISGDAMVAGAVTYAADAVRCNSHIKAGYLAVPGTFFNLGMPRQMVAIQIAGNQSTGTNTVGGNFDVFSSLFGIDRLNGSFASFGDIAQETLVGPGSLQAFALTAATNGSSGWPGNAGRLLVYSWATPGGGAEPCAHNNLSVWNSQGCKRVHFGQSIPGDAALVMPPVGPGTSNPQPFSQLTRGASNTVCTLAAVQGPFRSSGSYADVSIQDYGNGLGPVWTLSVGDTTGQGSLPTASAECFSSTLTSTP